MPATVIQQGPSGWDSALGAFTQAFHIAQDLHLQRQKLELERQRVASQTGLEGAQAGEARSRMQALDDQIEQNRVNAEGIRLASAHVADLNDDAAFANDIHGVDPAVAAAAITHRSTLQNAAATVAHVRAMGLESAARAAQLEQDNRRQSAVQNILHSYQGRLNTPEGVHGLIADLGTVDPAAAKTAADTYLPQLDGDWQPVVGNDGRLIMAERKKGIARDTGVNLGPKTGAGGAQAQTTRAESVFALNNLISSIDNMDKLTRQHDDADINPVLSSMLSGLHVGSGGVGSGPGAGTGVANLLKSSPQNQFNSASQVFVHSLASVMPRGQRSMPLIQSLMSGYVPQAGMDQQTRYALRQKRLVFRRRVVQLLQQLQRGQPADLSALPGYAEDAQAAAGEQNGPVVGAPLSGGILDYANPNQVPK